MADGTIEVILIEDNLDDTELLLRKLGKSTEGQMKVKSVKSLHDGLELLARNKPDIILSDLGLPDSHGLDTVTKLLFEAPNIPLVVLSGLDDEAIAIKAVQSGAQDYLVKGQLEGRQIERSLFYAIERARLQTELDQHTQEITRIQANLLKILDKNADAIIVAGKDGKILFTNPAAASLLDRRKKDLINRPFSFPLGGGKTSEIEITHRVKGKITAEMSVVEIDWEGQPAYLASLRDITRRKQVEEAIRESEAKFSKAFHSSATSFAIHKLKDGNFIEVNNSFTRMTGYTRKEVIGRNATELKLWADEEEYNRITTKTRENERVRSEQIKIRSKSGEIRFGLFSSEQITVNGEACVIHTITDITELKRVEESLRVSEDKFYKAFRHSPEVLVISNLEDGTILEANDTFLRLNGYTREEVIGRKSLELGLWVLPEERAEIMRILKEKGIVSNRECQMRMKSGEIRIWLFSAEIININNKRCMLSVTTDITERKKVEEKLRFSDTALNSIREGVFALDNEFKITRWNEMCEQMFGIKASEAIGKIVGEIMTMVEEYSGQNEKRMSVLTKKGFNREEQIYRTPRGDIWVDVQAQAIEENGEHYGWVTLVSDISERKKTEEELRFSHAAFRSIHESIIATDTKYIITHWNEISEKIYGIKAAEAIGKKLTDIIEIEENLPGENDRRFERLESNGYYQEEQLHRTKHGEVWVDVSMQAIEENGKRYGWVMLASAITQRKLAEAALKQSEEKYRELISTSTDGIVSTDHQMRIIIWNQGAKRIFGYTEKEMLGQSLLKIIPEREHPKTKKIQRSQKNTSTGKTSNRIIEGIGLRKDGKEIPIELSLSSKKYEDTYIITAIIRDVTERKEAEEKLRKIDQMKSEFLSNVSHEIRTPLQSIGGFTKLLMNGQVPDAATQQEFLQIIDRETLHLGNLINGLLDMSRLESGRFQINRKLIPIRETIIDSIKTLHTLAHDKNITLNEEIPAELPEMEVDGERMRQVIMNLLSNAIKYSDPGGSVTVRAEKHEEGLLFQVSDRGIGIAPEAMPHLFERFYRAEEKTGRSGAGLGLYIAKQIIEAHGGNIWVESKVNQGSTFSFDLPLNVKGGDGNGKKNTGNRRRPSDIKTG
jgi:PAS domain S-box-containing protein